MGRLNERVSKRNIDKENQSKGKLRIFSKETTTTLNNVEDKAVRARHLREGVADLKDLKNGISEYNKNK